MTVVFANDTLIFYDACEGQMLYLSRTLMWFETVSRLKLDQSKSELTRVGEVLDGEDLASLLGHKRGSFLLHI